MADQVAIDRQSRAKVQEPGLVLLWTLITFTIYSWFWYYRINRELRDYGKSHGDAELGGTRPWLSVLAVTLGFLLIVPPYVSWWKCTNRIKSAQRLAGETELSGWLIAVLVVTGVLFTLPFAAIPVIVQDGLNKIWKKLPEAGERGAGALPSAPGAATGEPKLSDIARED